MTVGSQGVDFIHREFRGHNFGKRPEYCQISHLPICNADMVLPVEGGFIRVAKLVEREKQWLADQGMRKLPNGYKLTKLCLSDLRVLYRMFLNSYKLTAQQRIHIRESVSIMGGDEILDKT
ncbi:hypothetical protein COT97_00665 [Candidatus Falkowbacteria bacterium CG10_big_fil_rev_8_21_14_0_10_39_11]|uniref:Uncharacterized protein n=1 Tax=Candidatus Falkowbacteria bacterium CG10_big_fil_rev_8_21_14_0_10_39_11 TaxID=1974565 RepID=A0A2H0V650_9BACT|nr:MAG: hypothetical protein COT97_00665 [Candidatus Falkowbacteria bacterium CG10_big_fil_rev_8_21_14_0_10_39_11]